MYIQNKKDKNVNNSDIFRKLTLGGERTVLYIDDVE